MSECEHEFTMIDLRGHWHCSKCGIVELAYLRARAEAAEKERDELKSKFDTAMNNWKHAEKERDNWIDTARLYANNSDYHQSRRTELEKENERLKAEILAMRNCQNCAGSSLCVGGDCNHDDDECLQYGTHEKWRYE